MKSYVWPAVAALSVSVASGQAPSDAQVLKNGELERGTPAGKPVCIMKIDMRDFGGQVLRFGDLNGDQRPDVIAVQSRNQIITCITAFDLDGKILWQRGMTKEKRRKLSSDVAVQTNPLFPTLRSGPTPASGAPLQKQIPSSPQPGRVRGKTSMKLP